MTNDRLLIENASRLPQRKMVGCLLGVILALFILACWGTNVEAQSRGIGVSPAKITVENVSKWPHSVKLYITNFYSEKEWIEITLDKKSKGDVITDPVRFSLEGEKRGIVLLTFGEPDSGNKFEGTIKVQATRTLAEGLATGTGVEIPFSAAGVKTNEKGESSFLLAALGGVRWPDDIVKFGFLGFGVLVIMVIFFKLAGYFAPFFKKL